MESVNPRDLPLERLSTTDERGKRLYIHPRETKGKFKTARNWIHALAIAFFLILPWVKVGGYPAVLLDIPQRRFAFFGLTFWAHDAPMLLFLFLGVALFMMFVTAFWGRLWCGWACPQTVFTEWIFRRLEYWVEGDALERRALDKAPWNDVKIFKKSLKWSLFVFVGLAISHSFVAYFVGADRLLEMIQSSPFENPTPFLVMAFTTAVVVFDFGWFREQFCIILCPYGRFQSVLLGDQSWIIAYNEKRGEPRRSKETEIQDSGDCVDCYRCVDVCPTGIDIRRGLQMECIACTACIDACDEVMTRIRKPERLIRYSSLAQEAGRRASRNLRGFAYLAIFLAVLGGGVFMLLRRSDLVVTFVRSKTPYQEIEIQNQKRIVNHYKVDLKNQAFEARQVRFELSELWKNQSIELIVPFDKIDLSVGEKKQADCFVRFPKSVLINGSRKIELQVFFVDPHTGKSQVQKQELSLVGPYQ